MFHFLGEILVANERLKIAGYPTLYDEYLKWYPK